MINVSIEYRRGFIYSFTVEGHAGYAQKGTDIYCAGVSAVCQTALAGLLHHLKQKPAYQLSEGFMLCSLADNMDGKDKEAAQIILKTMETGLTEMQRAYKEYLRIAIRED